LLRSIKDLGLWEIMVWYCRGCLWCTTSKLTMFVYRPNPVWMWFTGHITGAAKYSPNYQQASASRCGFRHHSGSNFLFCPLSFVTLIRVL
jgi:hypothetical protein